jgi:hypothetical protein
MLLKVLLRELLEALMFAVNVWGDSLVKSIK